MGVIGLWHLVDFFRQLGLDMLAALLLFLKLPGDFGASLVLDMAVIELIFAKTPELCSFIGVTGVKFPER